MAAASPTVLKALATCSDCATPVLQQVAKCSQLLLTRLYGPHSVRLR